MPNRQHHHRRNLRYWFKKWFPFYNRRKNHTPGFVELTPPDILFDTTAGVKAALSDSPAKEPDGNTTDASSIPEMPRLPPRNQSAAYSHRNSKFRHKLKKFLRRLSYKVYAEKHSSSKNAGHLNETYPGARIAHASSEINKRMGDDESNQFSQNAVTVQLPLPSPQHRRRRSFRHRLRKMRGWRVFSFLRKKKEIIPVFPPVTDEQNKPDEIKVPWREYVRPILNSTALFMIAYQLSWFFYQVAVMITASFYRIDSVLYYYELMFPIGSNSQKWTPENIIIISLAGPFFSLTAWIFLRQILQKKTRNGAQLRTFLVWLYLTSMMLFFGAFVGGAITLEGFGYVIDWLFLSTAVRLILSIIFLCIITWLSWNVVNFLPESSRSDSWKNNRFGFVISRLIIPWFLGAGIMTLLKITNDITQHENIFDYDTINLATLLFAVVPALFNSGSVPLLMRKSRLNPGMKKALPFILILAASGIVLLFRFGLSYGLYFNLLIKLNMYMYN